MYRLPTIILTIVFSCFSVITHSYAAEPLVETQLPDSLSAGLTHLLALVDPGEHKEFDAQRIAPIMEFVTTAKRQDALYYAGPEIGSPSAYYEFDIRRTLKDVLKYNFSPDIPAVATTPSSARLSYWVEI